MWRPNSTGSGCEAHPAECEWYAEWGRYTPPDGRGKNEPADRLTLAEQAITGVDGCSSTKGK
jgi:hypothetical protein